MCFFQCLSSLIFKGLEKEEELRVAHMHLQEHQETINKLRKMVCDYTDEISHTQGDLKLTNAVLEAQVFFSLNNWRG